MQRISSKKNNVCRFKIWVCIFSTELDAKLQIIFKEYRVMATCKNFHTVEIDHEEFNCPLCLDIFETPKSFPKCAHKICKPCLSGLIEKSEDYENVECPICRQKSPIPGKGVDGFPTDTFLVRCIEKIPGVIERREIKLAVSRCKGEIEKTLNLRETLENQLEIVERNRKLGEELKKQVSSHSNEILKSVKKHEEEILKLIDKLLENDYGVVSQKKLEKEVKTLGDYLEVAQNCVLNVEETLSNDNVNEIIEMKEFIKDQLIEYSDYPVSIVSKDAKNLKPFDVTFKKNEVSGDNLLGKLVRDDQPVKSLSEFHSISTKTPIAIEDHSDCDVSSSFLKLEDYTLPRRDVLLHDVKLSFCPTRIAVSPTSYDIAILCKEQRKVLIYSPNAEYKSVIKVVYGNLSDMCFVCSDRVAILNRESNHILMYTKDGNFLRTRFHVPSGNLKYTYLSYNDKLVVVSTSVVSDDNDGDDVHKCIVIHYEGDPSPHRVLGEFQLNCPLSRAVYYNEKYYIADMNTNGNVVIKAFTESDLVQEVYDSNIISNPPMRMVSLLLDNFSDQQFSNNLHIGYPDDNRFDVLVSDHFLGKRETNRAKQWEIIPAHGDGNLVQVEIYNTQKLFKLVETSTHYHDYSFSSPERFE